jgi:hypothetical protein
MMDARAVTGALALVLVVSTAGWASVADIPLPIIAARGDLVVVGEATKAAEPQTMRLKPPDAKQPIRTWFRTFAVKVTRVLAEKDPPEGLDPAAEREVKIIARSLPPPQPGGPLIWRSDAGSYPFLRVGRSYVLILRKMPEGGTYYLPAYFRNWRPTSKEWIEQVRRAADVEKWPWGKAVDGLQIALLTTRQELWLRTATIRGPRGQRRARTVFVQMVVALRNTGKKPLAVSLYPEDRYLSVKAVGPASKTVAADFYSRLAMMDIRAFGPWAVKTLAPGELLFLGPMGAAPHGLGTNLELTAGKWKLTAGFTSKRQPSGKDAARLWNGAIESKPVPVEVISQRRVR